MSFDDDAFGLAWNGLLRLSAEQKTALQPELSRLRRAYAQPHRKYHNFEHIQQCLDVWDQLAIDMTWTLKQLSCMTLALIYHDAIYRPGALDNEARSARWFAYRANAFGVKEADISQICGLIMATQKHQSSTPMASYIVDVDLSILAAEPAGYLHYCQQIRMEYQSVSEPEFRAGRAQFLRGMLDRKQIYQSRYGLTHFEVKARQNMLNELDQLSLITAS